jgi:hypothetical protein
VRRLASALMVVAAVQTAATTAPSGGEAYAVSPGTRKLFSESSSSPGGLSCIGHHSRSERAARYCVS